MKPYYWYARQKPPRRRGRAVAIALGVALILGAAATAAYLYWHRLSAVVPGLPLPRPVGWHGFDLHQGPPEALVWVEGPHAVSGRADLVCSPLAEGGLQVALRTGDPELPVIALRFQRLSAGAGGVLQGEMFVTGRGGTGDLVGSTGTAELALRLRDRAADGQGEVLAGALKGAYRGRAGNGRLAARLHGCATFAPAATLPWGRLGAPPPGGGSES